MLAGWLAGSPVERKIVWMLAAGWLGTWPVVLRVARVRSQPASSQPSNNKVRVAAGATAGRRQVPRACQGSQKKVRLAAGATQARAARVPGRD